MNKFAKFGLGAIAAVTSAAPAFAEATQAVARTAASGHGQHIGGTSLILALLAAAAAIAGIVAIADKGPSSP